MTNDTTQNDDVYWSEGAEIARVAGVKYPERLATQIAETLQRFCAPPTTFEERARRDEREREHDPERPLALVGTDKTDYRNQAIRQAVQRHASTPAAQAELQQKLVELVEVAR